MSQRSNDSTMKLSLAALLGVLSIFTLAALLGYTGRDDSHITYFAADQLAAGRGFLDHSGGTVEVSSSLAFTVLLAAVALLTGLPAAAAGPFVSALLWAAAVSLSCWWLQKNNRPAWFGLVLGFLPFGAYWALSGMETSLYLLTLLLCSVSAEKCLRAEAKLFSRPTLFLGLYCCAAVLARPEAIFVIPTAAMLAAAFFVVAERKPVPWGLLWGCACGLGAAVAIRLVAGLQLFPNPVYAKQALDLSRRLSLGTQYIVQSAKDSPGSSLVGFGLIALGTPLGLMFALRARRGAPSPINPSVIWCGSLSLAICAFCFLSGGDWMEFGRFFVPAFFFVLLAAACALPAKLARSLFAVSSLLFAFDFLSMFRYEFVGVPIWAAPAPQTVSYKPAWVERLSTIHLRDLRFTDRMIEAIRQDPRPAITIASIQAGMVLYYLNRDAAKQVEFVDLFGLTSRHVHGCAAWMQDPYESWESLQPCINRPVDYVFDLDIPGRRALLERQGCSLVFLDEVTVEPTAAKRHTWGQFLMRCPKA